MDNQEVFEMIVVACLLAGGGLAAVSLWRNGGGWLLPPQRRRAVPWDIAEVAFAFMVMVFAPVFALAILLGGGFFTHLYGAETVRLAMKGDTEALARCLPWTAVAAMPFQVASILMFSMLVSNTQLYQLGLTRWRLLRNLALGALTWLLVTPVILLLNLTIMWIYEQMGLLTEKHPVEELARQIQTPGEWVLLALVAMVAAPLVEELVFRGVLQPWAMKRPWAADLTMAGSIGIILLIRADKLLPLLRTPVVDTLLLELQPLLFMMLLTVPYLLLRAWPGSSVACAIYASAVLFAAFHAAVWPSPIPLVPLGMVLGWLAYRTQSLTASMTLHFLFNSVAVVALLASQLVKGNDETMAPAPASTSSLVPGS